MLYQSEEIGFYLSILGPLMPFMYMESMVDGILKGLGAVSYTHLDVYKRQGHVHGLGDDQAHQLLRAGHYDDAVHRQRLEHRQR